MATADSYGLFWNSIDSDRKYNANSLERWLKKFFTSGVFNGDLQVVANSGMTVAVKTGYANTDGKVGFFDTETDLTLDAPNSTYPRIDTIVVRRNDSDRKITITNVMGAYSGNNPSPTAPVRTGGIYELVLAQVYVGAGVSEITQTNITDKRPDNSVCGWITGTVEEMDFSQFTAQFEQYYQEFKDGNEADFLAWFDHMKDQLDEDAAGHLQQEIDGINNNVDNMNETIEDINADVLGRIMRLEYRAKAIEERMAQLNEMALFDLLKVNKSIVVTTSTTGTISLYDNTITILIACLSSGETVNRGYFKLITRGTGAYVETAIGTAFPSTLSVNSSTNSSITYKSTSGIWTITQISFYAEALAAAHEVTANADSYYTSASGQYNVPAIRISPPYIGNIYTNSIKAISNVIILKDIKQSDLLFEWNRNPLTADNTYTVYKNNDRHLLMVKDNKNAVIYRFFSVYNTLAIKPSWTGTRNISYIENENGKKIIALIDAQATSPVTYTCKNNAYPFMYAITDDSNLATAVFNADKDILDSLVNWHMGSYEYVTKNGKYYLLAKVPSGLASYITVTIDQLDE